MKNYTQKFSKQIAISVLHRFATILNGVVITAAVARYIGPSLFANYSYILSLVMILGNVVQFGAHTQLQSLLSGKSYYHSKISKFFYLNIGVRLFIAIFCVLILSIYLNYLNFSAIVIILTSLLIISKVFEPIRTVKDFQLKSHSYFIPELVIIVSFAIAKIYFIVMNIPATIIVIILFLELIFLRFIDIAIVFNGLSKYQLELRKIHFLMIKRRRILAAIPYLIVSVAGIGAMRIDQIMLFHLTNDYELANYAVAARLSEGLNAIFSAILLILSQNVLHDTAQLNDTKKQSLLLMFLAFATAIFAGAFVPILIPALYGMEYIDSVLPCLVLLFILPINVISTFNFMFIVKDRHSALLVIRTLALLCINVFSNIILIPPFGAVGAAAATILAELFIIIIFDKYIRKLL